MALQYKVVYETQVRLAVPAAFCQPGAASLGLPAAEIRGFSGVLNSTTNVVLTEIERGRSFEDAIRRAQQMGIAETDPSADLDGWDAAVKVAALAIVLFLFSLRKRRG